MGHISTHVLDISRGAPGSGISVILDFMTTAGWEFRGSGITDKNGRIDKLLSEGLLGRGTYRVTFDTKSYFKLLKKEVFFPQVVLIFLVFKT
jgi:5-hydroxyisourate hydrolase